MAQWQKGPQDRGLFITFEGPEGSGKTTQMQLLKQFLEKQGIACVATREPGGTPLAEKLREVVKYHQGGESMTNEAELLLIAAGRAQHVRNMILPALRDGRVVLCDRFYDSTTAYQGYARGIDLDFIHQLNHYAACGVNPDLTILLDLTPEAGFVRTRARAEAQASHDRIEQAGLEFHRGVYNGYHQIAAAEPDRVKVVSATGSPDETAAKVREVFIHAFGIV